MTVKVKEKNHEIPILTNKATSSTATLDLFFDCKSILVRDKTAQVVLSYKPLRKGNMSK